MPDWSTSLPAVLTLLLSLTHIVVCVLALGVFPGSRKPSTAMAWLILVLAVPYFGFLIFLLFGRTSVGRKRREWQLDVNRQVVEALEAEAPDRPAVDVADDVRGLAHLNQNLGALPLTSDNTVEITTDYPGCFEAMRREVEAAEKFVHVQFYISAWDEMTGPFFEAMAAAAERGVEVRFLFDHLGSRGIPGYKDMISKLEATKIVWHPMLPVRPLKGEFRRPDLRNHRKILVVDGRVGFAGSQNLTEPGYNKPKNHKLGREWVELMTRVEGPIVRQLNLVFVTDWYSETTRTSGRRSTGARRRRSGAARRGARQVVPSGPGFVDREQPPPVQHAALRRRTPTVADQPVLRARRVAAVRRHHRRPARRRGGAVRQRQSRPVHGRPRTALLLRRAARGRRADLALPGAVRPARQALHGRRRRGGDRLQQHGHALLRAQLRGRPDAASGRRGRAEAREVQDTYRGLSPELTIDEWRQRTGRQSTSTT